MLLPEITVADIVRFTSANIVNIPDLMDEISVEQPALYHYGMECSHDFLLGLRVAYLLFRDKLRQDEIAMLHLLAKEPELSASNG